MVFFLVPGWPFTGGSSQKVSEVRECFCSVFRLLANSSLRQSRVSGLYHFLLSEELLTSFVWQVYWQKIPSIFVHLMKRSLFLLNFWRIISQPTESWVGFVSLDASNISLHSPLACVVDEEKLDGVLVFAPLCVGRCVFPSGCLRDFFFILDVLESEYNKPMCSCLVLVLCVFFCFFCFVLFLVINPDEYSLNLLLLWFGVWH